MSDDKFRQDRDPAAKIMATPSTDAVKITGNIPPAFRQALKAARGEAASEEQTAVPQVRPQGSPALEDLIEGLRDKSSTYDEITLPSKGVFYDGKDGPTNGVLHIRPMTGEEEQILATPRYVRKGQAINMIFQRCLQEHYKTENLLSIDRTFLLIWLRGISYSPEYDVEIKCPDCDRKFNTTINMDELLVNQCPVNYRPPLTGVLPASGYKFEYRLSRGKDESEIQEHRERHLKMFGDAGTDDSLIYRSAHLIDNIEGLKDKKELVMLIKKLPVQDVSYLRNLITDPPFGVDTKCQIVCASCQSDFEVDLPLESNFFFPRPKRKKE